MSGVLGFINLLLFLWNVIKRLHRNTSISMIFYFLLGYAVAGFAMRRLAFWIFTIICLVIIETDIEEDSETMKLNNKWEGRE